MKALKMKIIFFSLVLSIAFFPAFMEAQEGSGGIASDLKAAADTKIEAAQVQVMHYGGRVDHAAAGTGLRNFDSGTIRLRGIPQNSTVVQAFLYWAMICAGTTCPQSVPIEFEGVTIDTKLVATGPQPCWTGTLIGAYRADVTGLMPATTGSAVANKIINRDYRINAVPSHSAERDGRDPWSPITTNLPKAEGATLVVVYYNTVLPLTGHVWIHNGADFFSGTLNLINPLVPAAPSLISFLKFTRFGADGQVGYSTDATNTLSNEKTFFKGPTCPTIMPQIAGDGSLENHDSDWNGSDGGPLNQLWDTHTSTLTPPTTYLSPGAINYCVRYVSSGDCMSAIGHILSVR